MKQPQTLLGFSVLLAFDFRAFAASKMPLTAVSKRAQIFRPGNLGATEMSAQWIKLERQTVQRRAAAKLPVAL